MKILVVYYSRSGRSRKVAQVIAQTLNADLQEITPLKGYKGLFGFIRAGFQATRGKTPAIKPMEKDWSAYDLIVFGTPIWASRMSSPLRAAIMGNLNNIKKYAFYCTAGDAVQTKALADIQELIGRAPVATMTVLATEAAEDKASEKIKAFIKALPG
jgi:flavodoxin